MTTMHDTIRVKADGTIERGIPVPHKARDGARVVAAPPHHAQSTRFSGGSMIPAGVDQRITLPHDCANHLPGGDDDR